MIDSIEKRSGMDGACTEKQHTNSTSNQSDNVKQLDTLHPVIGSNKTSDILKTQLPTLKRSVSLNTKCRNINVGRNSIREMMESKCQQAKGECKIEAKRLFESKISPKCAENSPHEEQSCSNTVIRKQVAEDSGIDETDEKLNHGAVAIHTFKAFEGQLKKMLHSAESKNELSDRNNDSIPAYDSNELCGSFRSLPIVTECKIEQLQRQFQDSSLQLDNLQFLFDEKRAELSVANEVKRELELLLDNYTLRCQKMHEEIRQLLYKSKCSIVISSSSKEEPLKFLEKSVSELIGMYKYLEKTSKLYSEDLSVQKFDQLLDCLNEKTQAVNQLEAETRFYKEHIKRMENQISDIKKRRSSQTASELQLRKELMEKKLNEKKLQAQICALKKSQKQNKRQTDSQALHLSEVIRRWRLALVGESSVLQVLDKFAKSSEEEVVIADLIGLTDKVIVELEKAKRKAHSARHRQLWQMHTTYRTTDNSIVPSARASETDLSSNASHSSKSSKSTTTGCTSTTNSDRETDSQQENSSSEEECDGTIRESPVTVPSASAMPITQKVPADDYSKIALQLDEILKDEDTGVITVPRGVSAISLFNGLKNRSIGQQTSIHLLAESALNTSMVHPQMNLLLQFIENHTIMFRSGVLLVGGIFIAGIISSCVTFS